MTDWPGWMLLIAICFFLWLCWLHSQMRDLEEQIARAEKFRRDKEQEVHVLTAEIATAEKIAEKLAGPSGLGSRGWHYEMERY